MVSPSWCSPSKPLNSAKWRWGVTPAFFEVTGHRLGGVLVLLVLESELKGGITVGLYSFNLGNYTRAYFDNSARHVLAVGTENGCHSDFLSN